MAKTDFMVRILADASQGSAEFGKFGRDVSGFAELGSKGLTKLGVIAGAVGGLVATAAQRALDGISALAGEAVQASDATDKFKNTLNFAGIDSSTIDELTKKTRKYADDTVYDLTTIQNTTAQLAANSVPNYEELTEAAGNLNAVAGGNADTFRSVAMVLTQTAGEGKLTTENWNQLSDAIPGAAGKLQEALLKAGAYTGNFRDAMEKGKISSDEFNAALMTLGTQPVAVEAAKSTTTFEGALGNLQATIVGGLSDALNSVKPMLTGAITSASSVLGGFFQWAGGAFVGIVQLFGSGEFSAAFREAFGVEEDSDIVGFLLSVRDTVIKVGTVIGDVASKIPAALGGAFDWVMQNKDWLAPLVVGAMAFSAALSVLRGAMTAWAVVAGAVNGVQAAYAVTTGAATLASIQFNTATKAGAAAQAVFNAVMNANPIMLIITAIAALVAGLVYFFTQTDLGRQIWQNVTAAIGAAVTWLWESVIQPVFQAIGAIFSWVYENVIQPIVNAIIAYVQAWATVITWLWENVLSPVFQAIGAIFSWIWNNIISPIVTLIMIQIWAWATVIQWLWENVISPVFGFIGQVFSWIWQNVIQPVIDSISMALKGWGMVVDWLWRNAIQPAMNAIGQAFSWVWSNVIQPVASFIGDAIRNIGNVVGSVFGGIASFIGDVFRNVLNVVKGPINGLIDLINGVIGGLNSISVTIPDWVPGVGGQKFGFSLSKLPHLATGGVTSGPTLAVIGDNVGGQEVVEPIATYRQTIERVAVTAALESARSSGGGGQTSLDDDTIERLGTVVYGLIMQGSTKVVKTAFGR